MQAYRVETTVADDGQLRLTQLPFRAGQEVEVIVLPREHHPAGHVRYPLRGEPIQYEAPTEPVAEEDWEALR